MLCQRLLREIGFGIEAFMQVLCVRIFNRGHDEGLLLFLNILGFINLIGGI